MAELSDFRIRPNTQDQGVFDQVVRMNEYRLPPYFAPDELVVDLGAHIGTFLHAVAERGCKRIVCVEPAAGNFRILQCNADAWRDHGVDSLLLQAAVWSSTETVRLGSRGPGMTAAASVSEAGEVQVKSMSLDYVMNRIASPVRLMKLDIEGAEVPALEAATDLSGVQEIVGEIHYAIKIDGYPDPTDEWLTDTLVRLGFNPPIIWVNPFAAPNGQAGELGMFMASRKR